MDQKLTGDLGHLHSRAKLHIIIQNSTQTHPGWMYAAQKTTLPTILYHDFGTRCEMTDIRVWTPSFMNAVGGVSRINEYQARLSMNSEVRCNMQETKDG